MKPFDLSAAINGAKLVTRDGRDVTEFCYFATSTDKVKCAAIVNGKPLAFDEYGSTSYGCESSNNDLFLKSEKKKLYIAIDKEITFIRGEVPHHHQSISFDEEQDLARYIEKHKLQQWYISEVEIDV